ncbi:MULTISPECIES: hypothetical protein [Chitinophagaceae]
MKQIVVQKSQYVGKPFSNLLQDLKMQIKFFKSKVDIHYDTSKEIKNIN